MYASVLDPWELALFHGISLVVRFCKSDEGRWERVVSMAKEYRAYAAECMVWAEGAKSDAERDRFLEMAKAWLQAAAVSELASRQTAEQAPAPE